MSSPKHSETESLDDFDGIDQDGWEFDTIQAGSTIKPVTSQPISTQDETKLYTRPPESLPLVRMFMTAEQKAAEQLNMPSPPTPLSTPPSLTTPSSTPPLPSNIPVTDTLPQRSDFSIGGDTHDFLSLHSKRLVPRNLTPVSKLTPMTRTASADAAAANKTRARSHSEQRPDTTNSLAVPKLASSSPLARRVRSATTLRPPEDGVPLKSLVANKMYQQQQQREDEKVKDSHRRSISADNGSPHKKVRFDISTRKKKINKKRKGGTGVNGT